MKVIISKPSSEDCCRKLRVRRCFEKDSLIDITYYQDMPEYLAEFKRQRRENYILVK